MRRKNLKASTATPIAPGDTGTGALAANGIERRRTKVRPTPSRAELKAKRRNVLPVLGLERITALIARSPNGHSIPAAVAVDGKADQNAPSLTIHNEIAHGADLPGMSLTERDIESKSESFSVKSPPLSLEPISARVEGTRSSVAMLLAKTVVFIASALAITYLLIAGIMTYSIMRGGGTAAEKTASIKDIVEGLQPLLNVFLSQTLYPLATIAIGWYFAARLSEREHDKGGGDGG